MRGMELPAHPTFLFRGAAFRLLVFAQALAQFHDGRSPEAHEDPLVAAAAEEKNQRQHDRDQRARYVDVLVQDPPLRSLQ